MLYTHLIYFNHIWNNKYMIDANYIQWITKMQYQVLAVVIMNNYGPYDMINLCFTMIGHHVNIFSPNQSLLSVCTRHGQLLYLTK